MKRFLNSVLCMCIAVFCTHAQKKNVTSVLEVMDITTGHRCQGIPFFNRGT